MGEGHECPSSVPYASMSVQMSWAHFQPSAASCAERAFETLTDPLTGTIVFCAAS